MKGDYDMKDTENEKFETIKSKVLNLHALAERGEQGEAANARRLLEKLLEKYGLTLEQILSEKLEKHWYKFTATKEWEKSLLHQCYYKVLNVGRVSFKSVKNNIYYELDAYEYAEILNLFNWHKVQLGKEIKSMIKDFADAYFSKHNITCDFGEDEDSEPKILTPEEKRRMFKLCILMDTMEDVHYRKLIE